MPFKTDIPEPAEGHKDFVPIGQYKKLQKSLFESQVGEDINGHLRDICHIKGHLSFLSYQGVLESFFCDIKRHLRTFLSYQGILESFFVTSRDT